MPNLYSHMATTAWYVRGIYARLRLQTVPWDHMLGRQWDWRRTSLEQAGIPRGREFVAGAEMARRLCGMRQAPSFSTNYRDTRERWTTWDFRRERILSVSFEPPSVSFPPCPGKRQIAHSNPAQLSPLLRTTRFSSESSEPPSHPSTLQPSSKD